MRHQPLSTPERRARRQASAREAVRRYRDRQMDMERQSHFTVSSAQPVPVKVEPIPEDEVELEQKRIQREQNRQQRELERLQQAGERAERRKAKRRREEQDGPATVRTRQLAQQLEQLLQQKKQLVEEEDQLITRLYDAGADAEIDVERLQRKRCLVEQVVKRAEEENE